MIINNYTFFSIVQGAFLESWWYWPSNSFF